MTVAIRVALDVTPLFGPATGIGRVTDALVQRLGSDPSLAMTGLLLSRRARHRLPDRLPPRWDGRAMMLPAQVCHWLWRRGDHPRLTGYDLVHGINYVVPPAGGGRELVAIHDLTAWRYPELVDAHSVHNPELLDRALARGAEVHTGSQFVADELVNDLGVPAERVHIVVNGFTPSESGSAENGRRLAGGRYVVAIGTIEPRKDYVGLVEAMEDVWSLFPDLRLVIVGRPGWGADRLETAVSRCSRPRQITRLGYVSDEQRADLLVGAEVLSYPSIYEGFGLPVLEAMDAGVPVVATATGSIPEVAGAAATLVPPGEPGALAQAVSAVLADDRLRAKLIEMGRERTAMFSWDDFARDMVALYHRLVDG